jgi:photosystem II stability/assembly factor-like uncharacterized protein
MRGTRSHQLPVTPPFLEDTVNRADANITATSRTGLHFTKRTAVIAIVTSAGALLIASVALAIGSPTSSSGIRGAATSASAPTPWTTSLNETNAPSVPIPGGAAEGSGAFDHVDCPAASSCVAVGADSSLSGLAATSSNDGKSWTSSIVPSGLPELTSVSCSSTSNCVAVGSGVAITTSDGGASWSAHTIPTSNTGLLGVSCPSGTSTCVAVGVTPDVGGPLNGAIITSNDGGVTWSATNTSFPIGAVGGVSCASSTFCVAVGAQILVTNDGGQKWAQQFVNGKVGVLRTVSCGSSTTCVAIGANPMGTRDSSQSGFGIQSTDGGAKWSAVSLPAGSWAINALSCPDASDCILIGLSVSGSSAPLWTSPDGGSTWSSTSFPATVTAVSSVDCTSSSSCVYVGIEGGSPTAGTNSSGSVWSSNPVTAIFSSAVGSVS